MIELISQMSALRVLKLRDLPTPAGKLKALLGALPLELEDIERFIVHPHIAPATPEALVARFGERVARRDRWC